MKITISICDKFRYFLECDDGRFIKRFVHKKVWIFNHQLESFKEIILGLCDPDEECIFIDRR